MRKLYVFAAATLSVAFIISSLTSCRTNSGPTLSTSNETAGYTYYPSVTEITESESTTYAEGVTEAETAVPPATQTAPTESVTERLTEQQKTENSAEAKTTASRQEETHRSSEPSTAKQNADSTEVDLSIELPSANGKMEVDTSRGNKFTVIVSDERKIDAAYLVAVYSVPDSGQNYVFEFSSKTSRSEDDLRRVYLIDTNGKITGVAAKKASEKENISSVENWFCMNVLIKKLVFPAVAEEFE